MEIAIVGGLICAVICAVMADSRNRNKVGWAVGGFVFGIFAILALAILGSFKPE